MTAQTSRTDRPETSGSRPGRRFQKGNPGKPKGARQKSTLVGIEVCRAMAARAADRLAALVDSRSHRIAFEASRLVLAYAWGAPRQTLELVGDIGDLSRELAAALAEARARRASLDASLSVAPLSAAPPALPALPAAEAPALEAEVLTSENVSYPKSEPTPLLLKEQGPDEKEPVS